jgi:hypothetical protein
MPDVELAGAGHGAVEVAADRTTKRDDEDPRAAAESEAAAARAEAAAAL